MDDNWSEPVVLALEGDGEYTTISNTRQASWAMIEDWPLDDSTLLTRALEICIAVMEGNRPDEDARQAFLEAAAEADIEVLK